MTSRRAVLALDLGSSSVRAGFVDTAGEVLAAHAKCPHTLETGEDGRSQADPDALLELVAEAIDEALSELPGDVEPIAVAASCFMHSVCGVDAAGRPTTPVLMWADRRAAADARALREELDERAVHRRTGCVLHTSYVPAKLRWLQRTAPAEAERTARWISAGEYVTLSFCGAARVSPSLASGTGLLDIGDLGWDAEVLAATGVAAEQLSEVSEAPLDGLHGHWAERWPSLAELPWFPAAGDGACSNLGCGAATAERAALMVGTSGALRVAWPGPAVAVPEGLWCYRAGGERLLMGGALSNGGNVVAWLRETLRLPDDPAEVERAIAAMAPLAGGLTVLPLLAGERGPTYADDAHGAIAGLALATGPLEIFRATLEGMALRFAMVEDILDGALPGIAEVLATGGGLGHSPAWRQIMADALDRPVTESLVDEASTRGAALLALEALGELDSLEQLGAPTGETLAPDPGRAEAYREALERQRALFDATA